MHTYIDFNLNAHNYQLSGRWKIDHLKVEGEIHGNGIINERSVVDIEKNLRSNLEVIESTISNYSSEYREMCSHLQRLARETRKSSHILKYLELDFKISKKSPIHSYIYFGEIFGVNTGCHTFLYKWSKNDEKFKEIGSAETGPIDAWKVLQAANDEIFVIIKANSRSNDTCTFGPGLNMWKFQNNHLVHFKTILQNADDIIELNVNLKFNDRFFALDKSDVVRSYLISGDVRDTWTLSREFSHYSFVDLRASNDIMLTNSRKLVILESRFKSRPTRTFNFGNQQNPSLLQFPKISAEVPSPPEIPVSFKNRSTPTLQSSAAARKSESDKFLGDIKSFSENMLNGVKKNMEEMRNKTIESLKIPTGNRQALKIRSDNFSKLRDSLKLPKLLRAPIIDKSNDSEASTDVNLPEEFTMEPELGQNEEEIQTIDEQTQPPAIIIDDQLPTAAEDDERENNSAPFELIDGSGVRESENMLFPDRGSGEFLMVLVGPHFRSLYVVSRNRDATIKRNQNSIVVS